MYKRLIYLTVIILVLGLTGIAFAHNEFTGAGDDNLWNNPANWSLGVVPQDEFTYPGDVTPRWNNDVKMTTDGTICVIDATHVGAAAATGYSAYVGCYGGINELHILGGELHCGPWGFDIGRGANQVAHAGGSGYVYMTGGLVTTVYMQVPEQWDNGNTQWPMNGELLMTGGNIITGSLIIGDLWSTGHIDLHGGTIRSLGFFRIDPGGTLDIEEGMLIVDGNGSLADIQNYIDNGWITAYGGTGCLVLDYDVRNPGQITLTASSTIVLDYDLDGNGTIGAGDLAIFSENWLKNGPCICGGDFNDDGTVDFLDFAELGSVWEGGP